MSSSFTKIGIIGAGSMGSGLAMLFAENGLEVSVYDASDKNVEKLSGVLDGGLAPSLRERVVGFKDVKEFMASLGTHDGCKLVVLSLPHGSAADEVLSQIREQLGRGDILLDGGNEWYLNAERRQKELAPDGIAYLSMGVSGGYQAARRGPSMSLSGDKAALARVMPLLEKVAAKDEKTGKACVGNLGPGGCGHYVKMVHNGIEQGMLGIVNEAWEMLHKCMGMDLDTISGVFRKWTSDGELKRNYLIGIGADICGRMDEKGHVVDSVEDKVVQDADESEGTGVWCVMEAARRHVSAPTIASAHFFRVASADRGERMKVVDSVGEEVGAARRGARVEEGVLEDVRLGVYCGCLVSFAQGLNLIARASADEGWGVSLGQCMGIWREGCIIRSEFIADVLEGIVDGGAPNVLGLREVGAELKRTVGRLRRVVEMGIEWNAHIPTLSASYEYIKYCGGRELPSQFMEAELDYFGAHSFDTKSEGAGHVQKGKHHVEWQPA